MAAGIGADSDILQAFEPGWLDQHGYINTDPTLLTTADRLYYLDSTHRKTAKWHAPLAPGTAAGTAHTPASLRSTAGIHPVFRREAWLNITRADYARLKPVLTLASRFLDEPAMLPFFHGVLDRASMETLRDAKAKRTTKLAPRELMRVFGKKKIGALPAAASSSGQQVAVWLMIRKLKDCVRFRVGGCTAPVYAVTNSDRRLPGFDNASNGCVISVRRAFLTTLAGTTTADVVARRHIPWNPGSDADSGKIRTRWFMAVVLVHELCHAMYMCGFPTVDMANMTEPFYGDQRISELGSAWESTVCRGSIESAGGSSHPALPFGLVKRAWPGLRRGGYTGVRPDQTNLEGDGERRSPAAYGVKWASHYLIKGEYVQGYFTRHFWDIQVDRYGLQAFRVPKKSGIRERERGGLDADERRPLRTDTLRLSPVSDASDVDENDPRDMEGVFESDDSSDDSDDDATYRP